MRYFKNLIFNNLSFLKNTSSVLISSILVQIIPFLILPVLSRQISEESLGIYIFWISISATISILMTFKLDMAIFVTANKNQAKKLVQSIIITSLLIGFLFFILSIFIFDIHFIPKKYKLIKPFVFLLIINSIFNSVFQGLNSFQIFSSDFKKYNLSRIIQAFSINSLVIVIVLFYSQNEFVIISAHTIGTLISTLIVFCLTKTGFDFKNSYADFIKNLKDYKRFPIFSLPAEFINNFSHNVPYIFILTKFDPIFLGYYSVIIKALSAPIGLIGNSMLTVFKEEASIEIRENGNCTKSYLRILKFLSIIGIVGFSIYFIVAPDLFSIVFGENYKIAGELSRIMIPLFLFRFIASPLSYTLFITNKQNIDLIWQVVLIIGVFLIFFFSKEFYHAIYIYVIFYSIMYLINFLITKKLSSQYI
jgi:O-antigen/teichoic acid export membrane protein